MVECCDKKGVDFDQGLKYFLKLSKKFKKSRFWIFDRFRTIFWRFWKKNIFYLFIFFFENLQKSIKSDVFDTNGARERDFHEETIAIDTGETDFRSTVTHFMNFSTFLYFSYFLQNQIFSAKSCLLQKSWFLSARVSFLTHKKDFYESRVSFLKHKLS